MTIKNDEFLKDSCQAIYLSCYDYRNNLDRGLYHCGQESPVPEYRISVISCYNWFYEGLKHYSAVSIADTVFTPHVI